jgi:hypothetical protein
LVKLDAYLGQRRRLAGELRAFLQLPAWSNLRGDDVITLVEALEESSRVRATEVIALLRELDDAALIGGLITPLQASGAYSYDAWEARQGGEDGTG